MEVERIVSKDPEVVSGELVFAGTRVPARNLIDYLAADETLEDFLEGFPGVSREQAEGYLRMSAAAAEEKLAASGPSGG